MTVTQEELYKQFMDETKELRDEMERKVNEVHKELADFREPFDREFLVKTSPKKEALLPQINEIENQHRYSCHKHALKAHKAIDRLDKQRLKALAPLQKIWEESTVEERAELDAAIEGKIKETNENVESLVNAFTLLTRHPHEQYLEKAKELELKILNTPVCDEGSDVLH